MRAIKYLRFFLILSAALLFAACSEGSSSATDVGPDGGSGDTASSCILDTSKWDDGCLWE